MALRRLCWDVTAGAVLERVLSLVADSPVAMAVAPGDVLRVVRTALLVLEHGRDDVTLASLEEERAGPRRRVTTDPRRSLRDGLLGEGLVPSGEETPGKKGNRKADEEAVRRYEPVSEARLDALAEETLAAMVEAMAGGELGVNAVIREARRVCSTDCRHAAFVGGVVALYRSGLSNDGERDAASRTSSIVGVSNEYRSHAEPGDTTNLVSLETLSAALGMGCAGCREPGKESQHVALMMDLNASKFLTPGASLDHVATSLVVYVVHELIGELAPKADEVTRTHVRDVLAPPPAPPPALPPATPPAPPPVGQTLAAVVTDEDDSVILAEDMLSDTQDEQSGSASYVQLRPVLYDRPVQFDSRLVGETLSILSIKRDVDLEDAAREVKLVVQRNSFRSLIRPELSRVPRLNVGSEKEVLERYMVLTGRRRSLQPEDVSRRDVDPQQQRLIAQALKRYSVGSEPQELSEDFARLLREATATKRIAEEAEDVDDDEEEARGAEKVMKVFTPRQGDSAANLQQVFSVERVVAAVAGTSSPARRRGPASADLVGEASSPPQDPAASGGCTFSSHSGGARARVSNRSSSSSLRTRPVDGGRQVAPPSATTKRRDRAKSAASAAPRPKTSSGRCSSAAPGRPSTGFGGVRVQRRPSCPRAAVDAVRAPAASDVRPAASDTPSEAAVDAFVRDTLSDALRRCRSRRPQPCDSTMVARLVKDIVRRVALSITSSYEDVSEVHRGATVTPAAHPGEVSAAETPAAVRERSTGQLRSRSARKAATRQATRCVDSSARINAGVESVTKICEAAAARPSSSKRPPGRSLLGERGRRSLTRIMRFLSGRSAKGVQVDCLDSAQAELQTARCAYRVARGGRQCRRAGRERKAVGVTKYQVADAIRRQQGKGNKVERRDAVKREGQKALGRCTSAESHAAAGAVREALEGSSAMVLAETVIEEVASAMLQERTGQTRRAIEREERAESRIASAAVDEALTEGGADVQRHITRRDGDRTSKGLTQRSNDAEDIASRKTVAKVLRQVAQEMENARAEGGQSSVVGRESGGVRSSVTVHSATEDLAGGRPIKGDTAPEAKNAETGDADDSVGREQPPRRDAELNSVAATRARTGVTQSKADRMGWRISTMVRRVINKAWRDVSGSARATGSESVQHVGSSTVNADESDVEASRATDDRRESSGLPRDAAPVRDAACSEGDGTTRLADDKESTLPDVSLLAECVAEELFRVEEKSDTLTDDELRRSQTRASRSAQLATAAMVDTTSDVAVVTTSDVAVVPASDVAVITTSHVASCSSVSLLTDDFVEAVLRSAALDETIRGVPSVTKRRHRNAKASTLLRTSPSQFVDEIVEEARLISCAERSDYGLPTTDRWRRQSSASLLAARVLRDVGEDLSREGRDRREISGSRKSSADRLIEAFVDDTVEGELSRCLTGTSGRDVIARHASRETEVEAMTKKDGGREADVTQ